MKIPESKDTTDGCETSLCIGRNSSSVLPVQKVGSSCGLSEDSQQAQEQRWRRKNLCLEIPSRTFEASHDSVKFKNPPASVPTPRRVNFLLTPSPSNGRVAESPGPLSSKGRSSLKNLIPKFTIKNRSSSDGEKHAIIIGGGTSTTPKEKISASRSSSLPPVFTPGIDRTSSLPVTPNDGSNTDWLHYCGLSGLSDSHYLQSKESQRGIARSLSLPANSKVKRRRPDSFIRVIPSPRVKQRDVVTSDTSQPVDSVNEDDEGEDIPEEEVVCRICMVELSEGGETLKLECSCKGELALAHEECAVKWFCVKGNKICDICKQEVQNLPVTLLRIRSTCAPNAGSTRVQQFELNRYRVWQDLPVLVIVSMLAYFCFLEQLLVARKGTRAIAISLPFSCVLGLLSSMIASTMVMKRFIWVYASVQFALVVIFAHIFYSVVGLNGLLSILLATFTGFGVAMSMSSVVLEVLRWQRQWDAHVAHQGQAAPAMAHQEHQPNSVNLPWTGFPSRRTTDIENPETFSGN